MSLEKRRKTSPRTWLRRILLVGIGLLVGVNVYRWNASALAGNALPMPFGIGTAVVMSGSMEPTLSVNDLVIISQSEHYEVGDIIVYQSEDSLVIHRIVEIEDEMVTARGDANDISDAPISEIYIKGKLLMAVPHLGGVARALKSLPGTLILLVAAILLFELSWRREKAGDEEKLDAIKEEIRALQQEVYGKEGEQKHENET